MNFYVIEGGKDWTEHRYNDTILLPRVKDIAPLTLPWKKVLVSVHLCVEANLMCIVGEGEGRDILTSV